MFAQRTNWNLASNRLSQALARRRAEGKCVLDLTTSNPTACGFHFDAPAILSALANPAALAYEPDPRGLESARRAVSNYYAGCGAEVPVADIFLTTGTSEAYSFVFRALCDPGDEILVPVPSYPLFDFLADLHDVKLAPYPLVYDHGWQMDFHALQQAIAPRTRAVIVVHPNNPTGHYVKPEEAAKLTEICSARGIAVIADEVFLDFSLREPRPATFATSAGALIFTFSGLSKISGLPQMKAAWLVVGGPRELKAQAAARLEVIADTFLSMNAPVQLAVPAFLEMRHSFQRLAMSRIRKNLAALDARLASQKSCGRLEVEGGWYAVLSVPATRPDEDLAIELVEREGVSVHPGHFYNFSGDRWLLVSLLTLEHDFAEGIERLLAMF